jgi:hypothetical protein
MKAEQFLWEQLVAGTEGSALVRVGLCWILDA